MVPVKSPGFDFPPQLQRAEATAGHLGISWSRGKFAVQQLVFKFKPNASIFPYVPQSKMQNLTVREEARKAVVSPLAELPASTESAVPGCSKDTGQARGTKHQQPQPSLKSKGPSCPSPGLDALVLAGASPPELSRKSPQSLEDLELRACCRQHQQSPRDRSISCGLNVQPASADTLLRHLFAASLATSPDPQSGLAADLGAGNRQAAGQHPAHQSRVTPSSRSRTKSSQDSSARSLCSPGEFCPSSSAGVRYTSSKSPRHSHLLTPQLVIARVMRWSV